MITVEFQYLKVTPISLQIRGLRFGFDDAAVMRGNMTLWIVSQLKGPSSEFSWRRLCAGITIVLSTCTRVAVNVFFLRSFALFVFHK